MVIINRGFAEFVEFHQAEGKRGVGEYKAKIKSEL